MSHSRSESANVKIIKLSLVDDVEYRARGDFLFPRVNKTLIKATYISRVSAPLPNAIACLMMILRLGNLSAKNREKNLGLLIIVITIWQRQSRM